MARTTKSAIPAKTAKATKTGRAAKATSGPKAPKGWFLSGANPGMYKASVDTSNPHSGTQCAYVHHGPSVGDAKVWATLMQCMGPEKYFNRRVRMRLWVRTKGAGWVQPWMRVDGQEENEYLSFDNMCKRYITGTTDWKEYSIVLDVPLESTNICFGIILGGKGHAWLDDVSFERVSKRIPITDCPCSPNTKVTKLPQNLNFEES